ncbi:family 2 glycosyl transferase [Mucilaginibacter hurinus]|uniref:Family 2 glycosyl transferase n=1 Tax=Mucilaginibacter hurinus TaxID=2201324 RepID=A0A367GNL9_9SPHI|nr:glycosyltransferase [Mucilaginibacter hurinus]RCH54625.1 family 2 glycosyl transferase [Mucilaginibacter hurinus]
MTGIKVGIVTVTYGNRFELLKQVIDRVTGFSNVSDIIIVDNASVYDVKDAISNDKVTVLTNSDNRGSAGGYKQGIEYCYNHTAVDFIWLLDDDNLPAYDCLNKLLTEWDLIKSTPEKKALFCFRKDRIAHVRIAQGEDPGRYYLVPDNFLGFSFFRIFINKFYKARDIIKRHNSFKERVLLPYVPYGGLLMHRNMVTSIGLPDERFFLYVDDSEYSYRITQSGGKIWLIPSCEVVDIDKSQGIGYSKRCFHSQLLDQWNFRTYYHIRNRVYFYKRVAVQNNFVFALNKTLYLAYLHWISIFSGKQAEFRKLKSAINEGLSGNLGKINTDNF